MSEPKSKVNTSSLDSIQANAWRMKRFKGPKSTGPFGVEIDGTEYIDVQPPGWTDHGILDRAVEFLKHPKPGCLYGWRARDDYDTEQLVSLGFIRLVKFDELNKDRRTVSLNGWQSSGFPDANGNRKVETYAAWRKMVLVEYSEQIAYEWFQQPADYHMKLVTTIPEEMQEQFGDMGVTAVVRKNMRSAGQEAIHEARKR